MILHLKDTYKLFGIALISFCAVFVCHMFLNFNLDIQTVKDAIATPDG